MKDNVRDAGMDQSLPRGDDLFLYQNRDRNAGRAGVLGEIERTLLEGLHVAVERAPALNECRNVQSAQEDALRVGNGCPRAFGAARAANGNEFGQLERVATMGSFNSERLRNTTVRPGRCDISAGASRLETWLAMKMQARPAGIFSWPWI